MWRHIARFPQKGGYEMQMDKAKDFVAVYTKKMVVMLVGMGYKVAGTFPNPNNPKLTVWVFKNEGNFAKDFLNLKKEVHDGRK